MKLKLPTMNCILKTDPEQLANLIKTKFDKNY